MLIVGLAALVMADPRPPRPSDEMMLALVAERGSGVSVVESHDRPMPSDLPGAKGLCGIAVVDGVQQPFFVYTLWRPDGSVDGNRWATTLRMPRSPESIVSDNTERLGARTACPESTAPEGVEWPTSLPHAEGVIARSTDRVGAEGQIIR